MKKALIILILMAAAPLLTAADNEKTIQREFNVGTSPSLVLENISGDINVTAGSDGKVIVKAMRESVEIDVIMTQNGDRVQIKTKYPHKSFQNNGDVSFEVQFPAQGGGLEIQSVSGSVNVTEVSGKHSLNSVSGMITVSDLEGELKLSSVSGSVTMSMLGVTEVDANSISGNVEYRKGSLMGGDYSFSSTSGNVLISHDDSAAYHLSGRTISGKISNKAGGDLKVEIEKYSNMQSISGTFNGNGVSVSANTVSGSILIELD